MAILNRYSVEYEVEGKKYEFSFYAKDFDDAEKHLNAISICGNKKVWQIVSITPDSTNVCSYMEIEKEMQ